MSNDDFQFQGKYIIKADLRCLTGLHIGGTQEGFEIGGVDNPVMKDPLTGYPYIAGSSLKGKMRSLLEWALCKVYIEDGKAPVHSCGNDPIYKAFKEAIEDVNKPQDKEFKLREFEKKINKVVEEKEKINKEVEEFRKNVEEVVNKISNSREEVKRLKERIINDKLRKLLNNCPICQIFGVSAGMEISEPTRLTVRDAFPKSTTIEEWGKWLGENIYTELKTENAIDRITSEANPRTMERVPKDSVFEIEMVYDIYKDTDRDNLDNVFKAMALLEDSTLGGSGSRGHGKVIFEKVEVIERTKDYYLTGDKGEEKVVKVRVPQKSHKGNPAELNYGKLEVTWGDTSQRIEDSEASPSKYLLSNWRKKLF